MHDTNQNVRTFYTVLGNTLIANVTNTFVFFALTFWVFLQTQSVLATSYIAGIFAVTNMLGAVFFGTIVDHNYKKTAMAYSSIASLFFYAIGTLIFVVTPTETWSDPTSLTLWSMMLMLMIGSVIGNLRIIALSTTVTILFDHDRDKANGLIGATQGISFAVTSILSGLTIGFFGMGTALIMTLVLTILALVHLLFISIPEKEIVHTKEAPKTMDLRGTIAIVLAVPGLMMLIFFHTFNNFLGGVFMALMDAYGLSLVSVETWGFMWGALSLSMIASSAYVAKFGLGENPLRLILIINLISWATCLIFPIQASIVLLGFGMFMWLLLMPIAEAAEQTVIQNIVPLARQGRVFGFAQSIESAASPITTFLIGPIAQFIFIPFMTTGAGVGLIGSWFGVGPDRGIALVFICAGILGCIVTLLAFRSVSYRLLSAHYMESQSEQSKGGVTA